MNSDKIDLLLTQNTDKLLQVLSERANLKINTLDQLKDILAQNKQFKDQLAATEKEKNTLKNLLRDKAA